MKDDLRICEAALASELSPHKESLCQVDTELRLGPREDTNGNLTTAD